MSKQCHFCEKRTVAGRSISHAHNVSNRPMRPNLQKIRAQIDGTVRRVWVCTRCLRSGKITKPERRSFEAETS